MQEGFRPLEDAVCRADDGGIRARHTFGKQLLKPILDTFKSEVPRLQSLAATAIL
jgi:hypothetical protein